jgi:hypothetical protein
LNDRWSGNFTRYLAWGESGDAEAFEVQRDRRLRRTIQLDNGEVVYVSIAQTGVLVRKWDMNGGLIKSLLSNFFGPKLYTEGSVYKNAQTARALRLIYPQQPSPLPFKNPVLAAFSNAIWHCSSAAEVCMILNEAIARSREP